MLEEIHNVKKPKRSVLSKKLNNCLVCGAETKIFSSYKLSNYTMRQRICSKCGDKHLTLEFPFSSGSFTSYKIYHELLEIIRNHHEEISKN